jgi:hypothetical protein
VEIDKVNVDVVNRCFVRLEEASKGENSHFLEKLQRNCKMAIAALESSNVINEAQDVVKSLKSLNKKISMSTHLRSVDNVLVYIFLKNLMTSPSTTKAYKLGLIDAEGNLIREPKTEEENDSISNLDLFVGKLRTWLRPHLSKLARMSWVKSMESNYRIQNALGNYDSLSKRATVIRVNDELDKVLGK